MLENQPFQEPFQTCRIDSMFAPNQWEATLLCNDVSHWLGANLESALDLAYIIAEGITKCRAQGLQCDSSYQTIFQVTMRKTYCDSRKLNIINTD